MGYLTRFRDCFLVKFALRYAKPVFSYTIGDRDKMFAYIGFAE